VRLLIAGAGGHAKVVVDAALEAGIEIAGVVGHEGDPSHVQGVPVVHDAGSLDASGFIVAVGDNRTRSEIFAEYSATGLAPMSVVHPSALIARTAVIGAGTFVAAGVIVNADSRIGRNTILNTGCTIDHDCVIGDHAHVGPNASTCGAVTVEEGALVGIGCSLLAARNVGEWAVVGAGSTVVRDVPAGRTYIGTPARPLNISEE